MGDETPIASLMARVRGGDRSAAKQLVERFRSPIHRAIRVRLAGSRLRRVMDSEDLLQSVFRVFWAQRQHIEADDDEQLLGWLMQVARTRVLTHARTITTKKRGGGQVYPPAEALDDVPASGPSLLSEIATRELLEQILEKLPSDIRRIVLARATDKTWGQLALEEGTTAEALRKKVAYALLEYR